MLIPFLPLAILVIVLIWGTLLQKAALDFKRPPKPLWPFPHNPGLALQLADSDERVNDVLGPAGTDLGDANRKVARRLQKLDFPFIVLYVFFFSSVPFARSGLSRGWIAVVTLALLTALFDVIENVQILRMVGEEKRGSAKRFGQTKWFFYFATLAAQGGLLLFEDGRSSGRELLAIGIGIALILIAVGGIIPSVKGRFGGIKSATKLSALGLLTLACTPLIGWYPYSFGVTAEYVAHLRVPLLISLLLLALPFIAFHTNAKMLLRGLFDLTPLSLFVVTISALAVSGTVCATASLILKNGATRFKGLAGLPFEFKPEEHVVLLLIVMVLLALPVILRAFLFSARQRGRRGRLAIAAVSGTLYLVLVGYLLITYGADIAGRVRFLSADSNWAKYLISTGLFYGYLPSGSNATDPWSDHLFAAAAFGSILLLYIAVGLYGWWQLGKERTVPALSSALMLLLMLGWMLPGLTFFFDAWRVPTLLIIAAVGFLTAQSHYSDHFYHVMERGNHAPAPKLAATLTASHQKRVIVVAANGGGIQAAAWAAQVLYGLTESFPEKFEKSLRLISSVSGGSVGTGFFVNWLANKKHGRRPHDAAAESSLDEVAWGLAAPDFVRALIPWLLGSVIDRGRALELAWLLNSGAESNAIGKMDDQLSTWNEKVAKGEIPAVIMNGTIAETGERVGFATTQLSNTSAKGALMDATDLHTVHEEINGEVKDKQLDVGVVTAARLSATFPYVTPAARADHPSPKPHVVDGGYYDNYGMATLVEWLDDALEEAHDHEINSVLVIQIHGAPVDSDRTDEREAKSRGWFYQAFVPLTTLLSVRSAGQVAHNNLEVELMQQKWSAKKVPIHTVIFEFNNADAPLSWHLTPEERKAIENAWRYDDMKDCKDQVRMFLEGSDSLGCGCVSCKSVLKGSKNGRGAVVDASVIRT